MKTQAKIENCVGKTIAGYSNGCSDFLLSFTDGTYIALKGEEDGGVFEHSNFDPMRPGNRYDSWQAEVITEEEYDAAEEAQRDARRQQERARDMAELERLAKKYGMQLPPESESDV